MIPPFVTEAPKATPCRLVVIWTTCRYRVTPGSRTISSQWMRSCVKPRPRPRPRRRFPVVPTTFTRAKALSSDNTRKDFDLGEYLNRKQREVGFGPRVVIRLSGSGQFPLSQSKSNEAFSLVLFVESGEATLRDEDKLRPIVFELKRTDDRDSTPGLIELLGGSLTLTNLELRLRDSEHARDLPAWMLRVSWWEFDARSL